jgi:hypothetical protein
MPGIAPQAAEVPCFRVRAIAEIAMRMPRNSPL